jgi:hypothetical protein
VICITNLCKENYSGTSPRSQAARAIMKKNLLIRIGGARFRMRQPAPLPAAHPGKSTVPAAEPANSSPRRAFTNL